jgi:hypothetical protein
LVGAATAALGLPSQLRAENNGQSAASPAAAVKTAPSGRPIMPPWSVIDAFPLFADSKEVRMRNRATVEKYLSMAAQERIDRWKLYSADCKNMIDGFLSLEGQGGAGGQGGPGGAGAPGGAPGGAGGPGGAAPGGAGAAGGMAMMSGGGLENQKQMELMNATSFPDWKFYNNIIFETEDPAVIVAEGDGSGMSYMNKEHPVTHADHYFHVFRLVNGKIKNYTEVRNETHEQRELGNPTPMPSIPKFEAMYEEIAQKDEPYECSYVDDPAERRANLATVKKYFSCVGKDCAQRWQLFAEDGNSGPGYMIDDRILRAQGQEKVKAAEAIRAECFPDWKYTGVVVHETTDPKYFAAEAIGQGQCVGWANKPFQYKEHFFYSFRMEGGKIKALREHYEWKTLLRLVG